MAKEIQRPIAIPEPTNDVDALWNTTKFLKEAVEVLQGIRGDRAAALSNEFIDEVADLQVQIDGLTGGTGASAIADGTADGQLLVWDETTDQAWEATSALLWDEANLILSVGNYLSFDEVSTTNTDIKSASGDTIVSINDTDGPQFTLSDFQLRLINEQRIAFWSAGSRNQIFTETDGSFRFTAENPAGTPKAIFDYPITVQNNVSSSPTANADQVQLWNTAYVTSGSPVMLAENEDTRSFAIANYVTLSYGFWTSTTTADPTIRLLKINNAAFASATELYANDADLSRQDQGWFWSMLDIGDILKLHAGADGALWAHFEVTSVTDNTGWWTIGITHLASSGTTFINQDDVQITVERQSLVAGAFLSLAGGSMDAASHTIFPLHNDAVTPTIAFGDGDSGFYEQADDEIAIAILGARKFYFAANGFEGNSTNAPRMLNGTPSGANPTIMPSKADTNTGIGWNAADQLSLVAGGKEMLRLSETGVATTDQVIIGPAGIIGTGATPALAFGDGDTGFFEASDDTLGIAIAAVAQIYTNQTYFRGVATNNFEIQHSLGLSTTAPHYTFRGDINTGIGHGAVDELSLIAGGVEIMRMVEGTDDYVRSNYPILIGEIASAVPDVSTFGQVWVKSTTPQELWFTTEDGVDHHVSGGSLSETFGVVKVTTEDVTSSTTLQNDDELSVAMAASTVYGVTMILEVSALSITPDLKFDFAIPTGADGAYSFNAMNTGETSYSTVGASADWTTDKVVAVGASSTRTIIVLTGTIVTSTTAGDLQLRWAQNSSSIDTVFVRSGSSLMLVTN